MRTLRNGVAAPLALLLACGQTTPLPAGCDEVQTVTGVTADADVGLGFTARELASTLRRGRTLDVDYTFTSPPSGESGAAFTVSPRGDPVGVVLIDRADLGLIPPGHCLTGELLRVSMDAVVSFQLGTEPVTLGETRVDFEAQGLADHRVVLHSLWVVPSRDLPPEVMRQATEAVDGRHEVTHVELGLSGRLRPDARLDYQNWSWSLAIMNALDDSPEQHATNLIHGQWFPPGGEEVGQ